MAQIVKKVSIPDLALDTTSFYLHPEKSIPVGERLEPLEYLHHPGYWFYLASVHLVHRRARALAIPEEDRSAPGSSPASQIASKAYNYDTYLCPPPHEESPLAGGKGVDHSLLIIKSLENAITEFRKRSQSRFVYEISIQLANESMKREDWTTALQILRPLWQKMSFRKEGWWDAVEEVGWALRNTAAHVGDGGTIVAVDWELMNSSSYSTSQNRLKIPC
jgi:trafficking protein particle complex subunit 11